MTAPGPAKHKCAVPSCQKQILDRFLMCPLHWFKVPAGLQTDIYREYFSGLRKGVHPTREYAALVQQALQHIASLKKGGQLRLV
ncbi:MAG TPA: hypothetical protein VHC90_11370 [Bryobacteraceae bacterium]|nr:hypothetical protein [Bryobacteraceae bacterium]